MADRIVKIKFLVEGLKDAQTAQKTWEAHKKEVASYNQTLEQTKKSIGNVTQQMQLQRVTQGKLNETQKTLRQGMQLELIALRELQGNYRESAAAAREAEAAEAKLQQMYENGARVQRQREESLRRLVRAQQSYTKEQERSSQGLIKNARQLVLWTVGAASAYRLAQKLKRVFTDVIRTLFENTAEYKAVTAAQNDFKASLIASLGGLDSWKQFLEDTANRITIWADGVNKAAATIRGFAATTAEAFRVTTENVALFLQVLKQLAQGDVQQAQEFWELIFKPETTVETAYLTAYEDHLKNAAELQDEYRKNLEDTDDEEKEREKLLQRQIRILEDLIDAEQRRIEETLDLLEDLRQKEEDLATERRRALEDLAIDQARTLEDIELRYQRDLEDIRDDAADNRAKAEERLRLKLLQIEMRYRERLIRIEEDFQDAISDAIRTRDATAALQAIRRRNREQARAKRERDDDVTLAHANYEMQIRDQERALEQKRRDAEKARRRALEDLQRDLDREREDIRLNQEREMEDLNLFLERRLEEINGDYKDQIEAANAFYSDDKEEYRDYLRDKLNALVDHYNHVVRIAAAIRAAQAGISFTYQEGKPSDYTTHFGMAQGGVSFFTSPTTLQVAETRPEIVIAMPVQPPSQGIGNIDASVTGRVEGIMSGFEGRFSAMMTEAALGAVTELLQ